MVRNSKWPLLVLVALIGAACSPKEESSSSAGASAEKTGAGDDKKAESAAAPAAAPAAPAAPARSRTLAAGTGLDLRSAVTITSRRNHVGDTVTATLHTAAASSTGDAVIPANAEFIGTISAIAPAERAGRYGTLTVDFAHVRFGGHSYPVQVHVDSLGTTMVGRGVTAGDAGKVGAGAAVGAVAGRVIGGNATGTAVGAVAGAAAGTAVAVETRDTDITIQTGAHIHLTLSAPFNRSN